MVIRLRKVLVLSIIMLLHACAGGDIKQDAETTTVRNKSEFVDVDSAVTADFNAAADLMRQDKYAQAIELLKTVIEREQRLPAPFVNLAIAYNKLGDEKNAEDNLIKALKIEIGHPVANNELGLLYRKAGKFMAARTAYENAIKDNPESLAVKRNLGVLCDLYMHDYECALEQYENYLELNPDDKTVAIWVADVKQRLGK